jgi:hypothetical protein
VYTEAELSQLLYCCSEELRARRAGKPPGEQRWLRDLVRRLELEVAVASSRQESQGQRQDCTYDVWIGSRAAAQMLGCSLRTIQRRANDFDAQQVGGKLVFSQNAVTEYLEGMTTDGRSA